MPDITPNSVHTFKNMAKQNRSNTNAQSSSVNGRMPNQPYPKNQPRIEKLTVHHSYQNTQNNRKISYTESIRSINQQPPRSIKVQRQPKPRQISAASYPKPKRKRSDLREFMLGFTVGLIFFGAAAFVVCYAILNLIT